MKWLREAAHKGHAKAQAALGELIYEEMEALRAQSNAHDYQAATEAERWLRRAFDQGELDAARALVSVYVSRGDLFSACLTIAVASSRRGLRLFGL